jgi:hypothetical protein
LERSGVKKFTAEGKAPSIPFLLVHKGTVSFQSTHLNEEVPTSSSPFILIIIIIPHHWFLS